MAGPDPLRRLAEVIVPRAVEAIDVDGLLGEVDMDELLARIDVNALLDRIDVNALLDRVDVDTLLDRVDVDALLERLDVERLMQRVDIAGVVRRAQVDALVSATAGGLGNRLLDLLRRQLVGLDIIITRLVDHLLHRRVEEPVSEDGSFTGQLAGGATRLAAFVVDVAVEGVAFAAVVAVGAFLASLFVGHDIKADQGSGIWRILALLGLAGLYQWLCLVIAGRTVGRAVVGLRVTAPDGSPLGLAAATRRVLVYPFSFVLGLGLIGIVTGRNHRALHDAAAPSVVRYDWGDRRAAMPAPITQFLQRQGVEVGSDGARAAHDPSRVPVLRPYRSRTASTGAGGAPGAGGTSAAGSTTAAGGGTAEAGGSGSGLGGDGQALLRDDPLLGRHDAAAERDRGEHHQHPDRRRP